MYDELELDTLDDKIFLHPETRTDKSYQRQLFLIMSDTDSTFNFLISQSTPSSLISNAKRPMTSMAADCRFMCAV